MTQIRLRVGAWYGDEEVGLDVPDSWDVELRRPRTPAPLSVSEVAAAIRAPIGQPRLREYAAGRRRPVIILDDLTRPTPAAAALPHLLTELEAAGIHASDVTLLLGGGTHRPAPLESVFRKAGPLAAGCRVAVHQPRRGVRIGSTSFGTPVIVDPLVAGADLVIGIGGVYPQHSVGFGGGSKLLLGVLHQRSIVGLHYGHSSVGGAYDAENDFRRDLDEMAKIARFRWSVSLHVDGDRQVVRAVAGDPLRYHADAARFSRERYSASLPGDADVVIANAYPMDVSLTFARSKGLAPLYQERPGGSRILVASCPEGLGYHGLFPYLNGPRFEAQLHRLRQLSVIQPGTVPAKIGRRLAAATHALARVHRDRAASAPAVDVPSPRGRQPLHLYVPGGGGDLPASIPGVSRTADWSSIVSRVAAEQGRGSRLKVAVYTCAPLQCLEFTGSEDTAFLAHANA